MSNSRDKKGLSVNQSDRFPQWPTAVEYFVRMRTRLTNHGAPPMSAIRCFCINSFVVSVPGSLHWLLAVETHEVITTQTIRVVLQGQEASS